MKININYMSNKPIYEQIEDRIRQAVLTGELEHNALLPSIRQLAMTANVSTLTIKRVYTDLEREGMLYIVSGKGTFVRLDNADKLRNERAEKLLVEFERAAAELKETGADRQRLIETIDKIYGKG